MSKAIRFSKGVTTLSTERGTDAVRALTLPRQGRGVGKAIVAEAIARARAAGEVAMLVLGDPAYYGRFGFTEATPLGIRTPYPVAEYGWQALEISPGALVGVAGTVRVAPPLDDPELWREPEEGEPSVG